MLRYTAGRLDAEYSTAREAAQTLRELEAHERLLAFRRKLLDEERERAAIQAAEIRAFLGRASPTKAGAILSG